MAVFATIWRALVKQLNKAGARSPRARQHTDQISELTTNRLSVYLRCLTELEEHGTRTVSSQALAERFHLNAAQIRKDLAYFGDGVRGHDGLGNERPGGGGCGETVEFGGVFPKNPLFHFLRQRGQRHPGIVEIPVRIIARKHDHARGVDHLEDLQQMLGFLGLFGGLRSDVEVLADIFAGSPNKDTG